MKWIASAAFGMEGMTGRDLKRMGMQNVRVLDVGGATFEGDYLDAFRANLWLRTCDRIMRVMAQFEARSFEELFQGVKKIEWEKLLPEDARFPIRAKCVKSQLMSPSDVQKIAKRAMVERMKAAYGADWFSETGALFQIDISIRDDVVTVCVDASGEPLSKRGYRTWNGEAPLRETLAAALVLAERLASVAAAVRSLLRHGHHPHRGGVHRRCPARRDSPAASPWRAGRR